MKVQRNRIAEFAVARKFMAAFLSGPLLTFIHEALRNALISIGFLYADTFQISDRACYTFCTVFRALLNLYFPLPIPDTGRMISLSAIL